MSIDYETVIVGAGLSGLGMAVGLIERGRRSFVICERASRAGGTWRDNSYPGAACDVPSHLYSFSFAANPSWSRIYAPQKEILDYIDGIVGRWDLEPYIRYNCEVLGISWLDEEAHWLVEAADGTTFTARFVVSAWGQLSRPQLPDIPGRSGFEGIAFHSAQWQHDADVRHRRVGVIGSAASAIQIIPELAREVGQLTVFQRTPNWIVPRMDRAFTPKELADYQSDPAELQSSRDDMYREREGRFERIYPGSEKAREFTRIAKTHLETQVSDPELRRKLTPEYPIGCKRVLISDDYYPALQRDNVTLVTNRITRIEGNGVRTTDGSLYEVDVLIYATGFEPLSVQGGVEVLGIGGRSLRESWKDGPEAYLGVMVSGFPGLFFLYGPNTNLGHSSVLTMIEAQIGYALAAMDLAAATGRCAPDVREEVMREYNETLQSRFASTAWMAGCNSWYKSDGRVTNNWVGSAEEYRKLLAAFDPSVLRMTHPSSDSRPRETRRQAQA